MKKQKIGEMGFAISKSTGPGRPAEAHGGPGRPRESKKLSENEEVNKKNKKRNTKTGTDASIGDEGPALPPLSVGFFLVANREIVSGVDLLKSQQGNASSKERASEVPSEQRINIQHVFLVCMFFSFFWPFF